MLGSWGRDSWGFRKAAHRVASVESTELGSAREKDVEKFCPFYSAVHAEPNEWRQTQEADDEGQ